MKRIKIASLVAILLAIALSATALAATGKGLRTSTVAGSVTSGPVHVTCGTAAVDITVKLNYGSVSSHAIYVKTVAVTFKMNTHGRAYVQTLAVYQNNPRGTIYYDSPSVDPNVEAGQTRTYVHSIYESVTWSRAAADWLWAEQQFRVYSDSGSCGGAQLFYWYYVPGTPI